MPSVTWSSSSGNRCRPLSARPARRNPPHPGSDRPSATAGRSAAAPPPRTPPATTGPRHAHEVPARSSAHRRCSPPTADHLTVLAKPQHWGCSSQPLRPSPHATPNRRNLADRAATPPIRQVIPVECGGASLLHAPEIGGQWHDGSRLHRGRRSKNSPERGDRRLRGRNGPAQRRRQRVDREQSVAGPTGRGRSRSRPRI